MTASPRHAYVETVPSTPAQNTAPPAQPPDIITENADYHPYPPPTGYPPRPDSNPSATPQPDRGVSPFSQGSDHGHNAEARPKAPPRDVTFMQTSTLERIWGKFFDNGKPTERLGQLLRGIAVHLVRSIL